MRIRVLGCHGGELPGCRTTCLLFDGHATIDAGALTSTLTLAELQAVEDIFLTHSHFDHVKDVPLACDLLAGLRVGALRVHGLPACTEALATNVFNNAMWPDFTRIPTADDPVVRLHPFTPGTPIRARDLTFTGVTVQHPVDSVGFLVEQGDRYVAISGDTGPTQALWDIVNAKAGLQAVFIELSFPNRMQWLADRSGHFTPQTLAKELEKVEAQVPVFLYHLKPAFLAELHAEVAALGNPRLRILELDDELEF